MRFTVALLLLANVSVFAWLSLDKEAVPSPDPSTIAPINGAMESLVLLRERRADAMPSAAGNHEPPGLSDHPEAVRNGADGLPPPEIVPPDSGATSDAPAEEPTEAELTVPVPERICKTVGPFMVRASAQAAAVSLGELRTEPVLRTVQVERPEGYWVYLPSMPGPEAKRILGDLSARGVSDYFLGRQNVISLGVFSDKAAAEKRFAEIGALGYSPRLEPRFVSQEAFWVDFAESSDRTLSEEQWVTVVARNPGISRQTMACE